MALELKQGLKLSQQLVMTPQLQQAIKLLQLNRMELAEVINQELVENPILEENLEAPEHGNQDTETMGADGNIDPEKQQRQDEEAFAKDQNDDQKLLQGKDDFDWDAYIESFNTTSSSAPSMKEVNEDLPSFESVLTRSSTLEDHVRWQISMATMADDEMKFANLVAGNLNEDGYLIAEVSDLAHEVGLDVEDAEEVLNLIKNFDPIGVGSRNLKECLQIQSEFMNPRQPLVEEIIANHLGDLEKKNYNAIAKALSISLDQVIESTKLIMELEPKPGRSFHSGEGNHYITPDIYVYKVGDEFVISLNEDGLPKLKISPYYKDILSKAKTDAHSESGKDTKDYVQDKLRSALWLIRSIHNRQKTIYKVTEAIVERQQDFFIKGVQCLKPMILKDVANDIGMHESTISRVTTNKYMHTPVGVFELKYFFNSSISRTDGAESMASEAVKEKIKKLVSQENPKKPLSDQKIVELLKEDNINIARRTVAKYRDVLGILPSGKRKKLF